MTTHLLISSLVGLIYGAAVGFAKCLILWHKMLHPSKNHHLDHNTLLSRMSIGYVINIGSLLLIFFLRNVMPFDFAATLIAAAISLSLVGIIYPIKKVYTHVGEENNESGKEKI